MRCCVKRVYLQLPRKGADDRGKFDDGGKSVVVVTEPAPIKLSGTGWKQLMYRGVFATSRRTRLDVRVDKNRRGRRMKKYAFLNYYNKKAMTNSTHTRVAREPKK